MKNTVARDSDNKVLMFLRMRLGVQQGFPGDHVELHMEAAKPVEKGVEQE